MKGNDPRATEEIYQLMYDIYVTTVEKMWGQIYLSKYFFALLHKVTDTAFQVRFC